MFRSITFRKSARLLRNNCTVLFSLPLLIMVEAESLTYHVSSSSDDHDGWCQDVKTCYNLSEISAGMDVHDINISLILRPDNHSLASDLLFTRLSHLSINSGDLSSLVIINCEYSSKIHFNYITNVIIQGITFNGCLNITVTAVHNFTIQDSAFLATKSSISSHVHNGHALITMRSTVIIMRSRFVSFKAGKQNGGAINSLNSYVLLFYSVFMDNSAH